MDFRPHGIIPALVTPLTDDDQIDEPALRRLVEHCLAGGVHGLFACGSQGEAYALDDQERRQVIEIVRDQARGRVPVYAGTGAVSTRQTIRLTKDAEAAGADAVSIVTPYFITPSAEELYEHYVAIAAATRLPILLYPNPDRTRVNLAPELVARLARIENIVGVKDSSGDLTQTCEYIRLTRGRPFAVLVGRDTLIFAALACGAAGAIAATANVAPALAVEIYTAFQASDLERARQAQERLAPLRQAFTLGTFPVVVKEALALMGICSGQARAPIRPLNPTQARSLVRVLQELGLVS